jgi:hypothetical protein
VATAVSFCGNKETLQICLQERATAPLDPREARSLGRGWFERAAAWPFPYRFGAVAQHGTKILQSFVFFKCCKEGAPSKTGNNGKGRAMSRGPLFFIVIYEINSPAA